MTIIMVSLSLLPGRVIDGDDEGDDSDKMLRFKMPSVLQTRRCCLLYTHRECCSWYCSCSSDERLAIEPRHVNVRFVFYGFRVLIACAPAGEWFDCIVHTTYCV